MDDLSNSTPAMDISATSSTMTPEPDAGTVQINSDAGQGQSAPIEETFTKVDVNTLPPQLRQSYDNMLRDYKKKTTELSETIKSQVAKETEALSEKAGFYDQILGQEEFVKQWNEYVQKVNAAGNQNGNSQAGNDPALTQLKSQLQEISQKLQVSEMSQVTEAFADAVNEKGEKIHPHFDKLNDISIGQFDDGEGPEEFSLLRACIELSPHQDPQAKLANGYKMAEQVYNAIFEEGRKAGMGRVQSKVQSGTQPPTNIGGNLSMTEKKPKSAREALELARKGIMVSR